MKLECDDNVALASTISLIAVVVGFIAFQGRSCNAQEQQQKTERCRSVIAAERDPVTINQVCRGGM